MVIGSRPEAGWDPVIPAAAYSLKRSVSKRQGGCQGYARAAVAAATRNPSFDQPTPPHLLSYSQCPPCTCSVTTTWHERPFTNPRRLLFPNWTASTAACAPRVCGTCLRHRPLDRRGHP